MSDIKKYNLLDYASLKSVNGVAKASIKNFSGVVDAASGATDPNFANVSLLLHMDGNFTDNSNTGHTATVNGSASSVAGALKYGSAGGRFGGGSDSLKFTAHSDFNFGTGDFTIEFWMKQVSALGTTMIFDMRDGNGYPALTLYFPSGSSISTFPIGVASSVTIGTYHHIAVVKYSNTLYLYKDGVSQGTPQTDNTSYGQNEFWVSNYYLGGYSSNIDVDDLRITKGVARYTTNFTPPAAAFPDS